MEDSAPYYTEVKARKSTSMESIPQNVTETKQKCHKPVVNIHNKFGTVSGASVQNRPSLLPKESNKTSDVGVNRFRAVNRSFRTAVDKSLDVAASLNGKFSKKKIYVSYLFKLAARQSEGFVKRLIYNFNMLDASVPKQEGIFSYLKIKCSYNII